MPALTLDQGAKWVADTSYYNRIRSGMVRYALTVKGEAISGMTSAVYAKRQEQARRCLNNPDSEVNKFVGAVAADAAFSLNFYNPINITSSTNANPSVVTTPTHGLVVGDVVEISGHTTNTNINGVWTIPTVGSATTFTVPWPANGVGGASGMVVKKESDQNLNVTIQSVFNKIAGVIPDE